jgi:hypothetical protein
LELIKNSVLESGVRGCGVGVLGICCRCLYKIKIHKVAEKVRDTTDVLQAISLLLLVDDLIR